MTCRSGSARRAVDWPAIGGVVVWFAAGLINAALIWFVFRVFNAGFNLLDRRLRGHGRR